MDHRRTAWLVDDGGRELTKPSCSNCDCSQSPPLAYLTRRLLAEQQAALVTSSSQDTERRFEPGPIAGAGCRNKVLNDANLLFSDLTEHHLI